MSTSFRLNRTPDEIKEILKAEMKDHTTLKSELEKLQKAEETTYTTLERSAREVEEIIYDDPSPAHREMIRQLMGIISQSTQLQAADRAKVNLYNVEITDK